MEEQRTAGGTEPRNASGVRRLCFRPQVLQICSMVSPLALIDGQVPLIQLQDDTVDCCGVNGTDLTV